MSKKKDERQVCLNGAPPDTGNLGVCALSSSTIAGVASRLNDAKITVFDFGRGVRKASYITEEMQVDYDLCGLAHSRRYYRRENLWNMRVSAWLGGLGNPGVKVIANSMAMLDISGGDSFTDLYGKHRFDAVTLSKLIAIQQKCPLILLPQTYGPFNHKRSRNIAQQILRNTTAAWARDDRSFEVLKGLLGNDFDASRHRKGVDVAFSLPLKPVCSLSDKVQEWILAGRKKETVGLNISGLIYNDPTAAVSRYGFKADYRQVVVKLLRRILRESDVNIILVPHVYAKEGHYESDLTANLAVMQQLQDVEAGRVEILSPLYNESETKWIISKLDWFCGTRMHSTIAGLSTGVPTTAIAYSLKTLGVFETCDQGAHVIDPRELPTEDVIDLTFDSFNQRVKTRKHLAAKLPGVLSKANDQMDKIVLACLGNR